MKIRLFFIVLLFVLSFFLRVYNLSLVPSVLSINEIQTGLAAFSGTILSPTIGPLAIITTIPFVNIFGLSPIAVRFPSVLFAVLSIGVFFLIIRKRFSSISLIALLFLTVSPFAIQVARVDTGINLGFFSFYLAYILHCLSSNIPNCYFV